MSPPTLWKCFWLINLRVMPMEQVSKLRINNVIAWYVFHGPHFLAWRRNELLNFSITMVFFRVNDLQIYLVIKIRPIDFKTTQASINRIQAPPRLCQGLHFIKACQDCQNSGSKCSNWDKCVYLVVIHTYANYHFLNQDFFPLY